MEQLQENIKNEKRRTITRLTDEQKDFIVENAPNMTLKELSEATGVLYVTLQSYCRLNQIEVKKDRKRMLEEHKKFIFENHSKMTAQQLAETLGIPQGTVTYFCSSNKLKYKKLHDLELDLDEIKDMYVEDILEMRPDLGYSQLVGYLTRQGIEYKTKFAEKRLTEEDKDFIRNNTHLRVREILDVLNKDKPELAHKSKEQVYQFCHRENIDLFSPDKFIGTKETSKTKRWEEFIVDHAYLPLKDLEKKTKLSGTSIRKILKAHNLPIVK